jgi:hypothetical protein
MAVIYAEDWTAGNSLFTSVDFYDRVSDGVDPLYPHIRTAELVFIRSGRLDYQDDVSDYSVAGVWIKGPGALTGGGVGSFSGPGFWDGTVGCIECLYHPTVESLHPDNNVYCPLLALATPTGFPGFLGVAVDLDALEFYIDQRTESGTTSEVVTGAAMPVAGEEYKVRMGWQCGTYDSGTNTHAADGFLRVWINDALMYEATNISLFITKNTVPVNRVDSVQFGAAGLLGPQSYFTIQDSACAAASTHRFGSGGTEYPLFFDTITFRENAS